MVQQAPLIVPLIYLYDNLAHLVQKLCLMQESQVQSCSCMEPIFFNVVLLSSRFVCWVTKSFSSWAFSNSLTWTLPFCSSGGMVEEDSGEINDLNVGHQFLEEIDPDLSLYAMLL